ncbi:hypothetical protein HYU40_02240 [Candidatus Woesearchaeota archaeon]|nr:hypothetical protein [Candidatus Woesearchaeota archaeon]
MSIENWVSEQLERYKVLGAARYPSKKGWLSNEGGNFSLRLDSLPQDVADDVCEIQTLKFNVPVPSLAGQYFLVKASKKDVVEAVKNLQVALLRINDGGTAYTRLWGERESIEFRTHAALAGGLVNSGFKPYAIFHDHSLEGAVLREEIPVIFDNDRPSAEMLPTVAHDKQVYAAGAGGHRTIALYQHGLVTASGISMVHALEGNLAATGRKLPVELEGIKLEGLIFSEQRV